VSLVSIYCVICKTVKYVINIIVISRLIIDEAHFPNSYLSDTVTNEQIIHTFTDHFSGPSGATGPLCTCVASVYLSRQ